MGREMARAAGVQALVVASIRRFDQLYAIDLKVLDPGTSEYFFTLKEEREGKAAIPGMLDRLSERAREKLRETPAEVGASRIEVAKATTNDYEAWQHYFAGQKLEDAGEDEDAILEYTKAVAEDPRFALAHYRIAYLGRWLVDRGSPERCDGRGTAGDRPGPGQGAAPHPRPEGEDGQAAGGCRMPSTNGQRRPIHRTRRCSFSRARCTRRASGGPRPSPGSSESGRSIPSGPT